jgi:hypothetical protein
VADDGVGVFAELHDRWLRGGVELEVADRGDDPQRTARGHDREHVAAVAHLRARRQVDGRRDLGRRGVHGLDAAGIGVEQEQRVAILQHVEVRG